MNKYEKAIRFYEESSGVLEEHFTDGAFKREALEAAQTAIEAIKKQVPRALRNRRVCPSCGSICDEYDGYCVECGQATSMRLTECISGICAWCPLHDPNGKVCEHYAGKVDEIRRIHEEI